jgi:putative endopeptidase
VAVTPPPPAAVAGLDLQYIDPAVRPQDSLYRHINGRWLDSAQIPADRATFGSFAQLRDRTLAQLRGLIEPLEANAATAPAGTESRKVADLYASYLDEAGAEARGVQPLAPEFARIDALADTAGLAPLFAHLQEIGVDVPFGTYVHQDNHDSTRYIVDIAQSGLGMPDRDYYLADDARMHETRQKYADHVERMLGLAGLPDPHGAAAEIVAFETRLAQLQWTKLQNRDPIKRYNMTRIDALPALAPGFDWTSWIEASGLRGLIADVNVSQPSYETDFAALAAATPIPTWRSYLKWQVLSEAAPWLSSALVDEHFAFYGTVLSGTPQNRPRWERAVSTVNGSLGEALGQIYVDHYFPPRNKARIDALVHRLIDAFRASIDGLDWMGPETRREAQAKLAKMGLKIGYPERWRDYSSLAIARDDLVGNMWRSAAFESRYEYGKLNHPIDRGEWHQTPQTVNAYYNQELNEIVFPAGILQPPFFNVDADDAVNYGAIGAVIGHEMSHAFDDRGSQYDGDGNLRDWFTPADHDAFKARTAKLVEQYARYEPVPGYHVNGELTLSENIADNAGLAIAYRAYLASLRGQPAPVLDGLTGGQRFYAGFATVWRSKTREASLVRQIKVDPHAPNEYRCDGAAINQPGFYEAFDVHPGDKMYLDPAQRATIW